MLKIGKLASLAGTSANTLRYYEREGCWLPLPRGPTATATSRRRRCRPCSSSAGRGSPESAWTRSGACRRGLREPAPADAVGSLRAAGLHTVLLTGDNPGVAQRVADDVGIDVVHAGVLPAGKAAVLRELQSRSRKVAMVGDGINDGPALMQAVFCRHRQGRRHGDRHRVGRHHHAVHSTGGLTVARDITAAATPRWCRT
ncbi:MAG: HAD-IC family P-type ATPase [Rubrivivax sp.]